MHQNSSIDLFFLLKILWFYEIITGKEMKLFLAHKPVKTVGKSK